MDLKILLDTPPWDWPTDAGRMFQKILIDQRADESDRLVAAELAGDFTVIDDDLVDTLLTVVRSADEPEQLRAKAAISLGPVLEQADMDGFEDPDDVPITERTFRNIQDSIEKIYLDNSTPQEVRRRILEASVRAPQTWHQDVLGTSGSRVARAPGLCLGLSSSIALSRLLFKMLYEFRRPTRLPLWLFPRAWFHGPERCSSAGLLDSNHAGCSRRPERTRKAVRNVIARHGPEKHDNRGSIVPGKRLVAGVAFFCFDSLFLVAQQPSPELALDEAARAFEQGKTTEAEQKLRPILEKHPSDLRALLLEGAVLDSAGHQIAKYIQRSTDDVLQVEHGSLYPALHRMERKGWLASRWESGEGKRELKYYRLTAQGKKQLAVEESKWELVVRAIARVPAQVES